MKKQTMKTLKKQIALKKMMKIGQKTEERENGKVTIAEMVSIWETQCTIVECELRGRVEPLKGVAPLKGGGGVGDAPDHSSSTCRRLGERGF